MLKKWIKRIGYTLIVLFVLLNIITAFHAYKFTHFYESGSINKPEQMSGAEKSSAMLFGVNYPKSKVVDSLAITHTTINLTTKDGFTLQAWHALQADTSSINSKTTVILFHGHGGSKSGIIKEASAFYNMGYNVLLTDFRAHGNSTGNVCTIGAKEVEDVMAAYNFVGQKKQKIILWGISMGAATILKTINDYNISPQKVILEMPFGTLQHAVKGRLKTMHLPAEPFATLLTFWGGTQQGFWAFSFSPQEYAKKLNCPVLLQWGKIDPRVSEEEINTIYTNLAGKQKQIIVYQNSGHQSLCKNENEKWLKSVGDFLKE